MKKAKSFCTATRLMTVTLFLIPPLFAVSGQEMSAQHIDASSSYDQRPGESDGRGVSGPCSDLSGTWKTTTSEGSSTWVLRKSSDSVAMYDARESGPGNARGMAALLQENLLRLEFDVRAESGERYAGIYRCKLDETCQASLSPCKLVLGLGRSGSYEASIKRQ